MCVREQTVALGRLMDGRERLEEGKLDEALAELDETISLNPGGSEWYPPPPAFHELHECCRPPPPPPPPTRGV